MCGCVRASTNLAYDAKYRGLIQNRLTRYLRYVHTFEWRAVEISKRNRMVRFGEERVGQGKVACVNVVMLASVAGEGSKYEYVSC